MKLAEGGLMLRLYLEWQKGPAALFQNRDEDAVEREKPESGKSEPRPLWETLKGTRRGPLFDRTSTDAPPPTAGLQEGRP